MSEYFTLKAEATDDPDVMEIITSEVLAEDEREVYTSADEGDEGSAIAQALFHAVDGIMALVIDEDTLIVRRDPDVPWEALIDEVRDVLRDFFL
ncbi:MAG: hypothetical protein OHK0046_12700 [Anaerolineae bacterium]